MTASNSKESSTVKGKLSNISMLIALILGATVCKITADGSMFESSAKASLKSSHKHALKSSAVGPYPASYYDKTSSHYMGGAHNVALQDVANMGPTKYVKKMAAPKVSKDKTGHNLALQSVANMSREWQGKSSKTSDLKGTHNVALKQVADHGKALVSANKR